MIVLILCVVQLHVTSKQYMYLVCFMNPVMRNTNELVSKSLKARKMSVKYPENVPRISLNSADTSLIEAIGGNSRIQVFQGNWGK